LAGVEIVGRDHTQIVATLRQDYGYQPASVGFAIVHDAKFPLNVLLVDGYRIVKECLLRLLPLDPVLPNLTEVIPVPFEHRRSYCICNAYAEESPITIDSHLTPFAWKWLAPSETPTPERPKSMEPG
jgi:hypothetical protein